MQTVTQTISTDIYMAADSALRLVKSEMAGDSARFERETMRQHWMRCPGCELCWPEIVERETDI